MSSEPEDLLAQRAKTLAYLEELVCYIRCRIDLLSDVVQAQVPPAPHPLAGGELSDAVSSNSVNSTLNNP